MPDGDEEAKVLRVKAMINRERNTALFAEGGSQFVDMLFSFLTLPLGRIIRILQTKYGDEAPTIGSLSSLYHSLENLESASFVTDDAKNTLLNPTSSFEDEYSRLELDIAAYQPAEYFYCFRSRHKFHNSFCSVSKYYDNVNTCKVCNRNDMRTKVARKRTEAVSSDDGVFSMSRASFLISDDLQIFPVDTGSLRIISTLGIEDIDKASKVNINFSLRGIIRLLKESLTSPTPLSDAIFPNETRRTKYSATVDLQPKIEKKENPNSKNLSLKLIIQKSSGKLLYAQAKEDFVEFLFGLLLIPLGGIEHLLGGNTGMKGIDNLYRSITLHVEDRYFVSPRTKSRLLNPSLPYGCISDDYILPLTEEPLPPDYTDNLSLFSSLKFPKGKGCSLLGPQTYKVTDDLTVTPLSTVSTLHSLNKLKVPISDVKEVDMQIGLNEGLRILKASLTSTSALSDALLNHMPNKRAKRDG